MGLTTRFSLPYPEAVDPADVPLDMRELAEGVDGLGLLRGPATANYRLIGGRVQVTTDGSFGQAVVPFGLTAATVLSVVANNGDPYATGMRAKFFEVSNVTTTQFVIVVSHTNGSPLVSYPVTVNWLALVTV
jgi:hypothetical protein